MFTNTKVGVILVFHFTYRREFLPPAPLYASHTSLKESCERI